MSYTFTDIERERSWIESLRGVHFVEVAGRTYPANDHGSDAIAKGESYYHWSHPRWGVKRRRTCPRPSDLEDSSEATVLGAWENIQDASNDPTRLPAALAAAIEAVEGQADWCGERASDLTDVGLELAGILEELNTGDKPADQTDIESRLDDIVWETQ